VKDVGVPLVVAAIGLAGSICVAALSFAMVRWAEAAARHRDGYSAVRRTLVRYSEYCWRVRRRTSNDAEELRRLADLGHEIQEELAYHQLWTRSENAFVGRVFREVCLDMAAHLAPACNAAWAVPPIGKAEEMTLGDRARRPSIRILSGSTRRSRSASDGDGPLGPFTSTSG
jgi:hypothetical protein